MLSPDTDERMHKVCQHVMGLRPPWRDTEGVRFGTRQGFTQWAGLSINYHPQSGWFEDTPLKGGTEQGYPLKGV